MGGAVTSFVAGSVSARAWAALLVSALVACSGDRPVAPTVGRPLFANGAPPTTGPTVTSTTPARAPRNSTLNVTIAGSGFEPGARAVWALKHDTTFATTKIRTNSTTFVSSSELTANITIGDDTPLELFDVQVVTLGGRKGIGIELFTVTYEAVDLGTGDFSSATAINDNGLIVGARATGFGGFLWENGVLRDLGAPAGFTWFSPEDINGAGQVVGYGGNSAGMPQAVIWTAARGAQALAGSLGGSYTLARRINDQGLIVGEAGLPDGTAHTVVWENGVMRDIHGFASGSTFPWGLSNSGIVVGQWDPQVGTFIWTKEAGMRIIAGLEGPNDVPLGVNNLGQMVGWYQRTRTDVNKAFVWDDGVLRELSPASAVSSVGIAINDVGQIVGRSETTFRKGGRRAFRAFLWTAGDGMRDLGSLPNGEFSQALDINNGGAVVGESFLPSGEWRATLWRIK
jgi:probable HAF family extracellular repeat protein